MSNYWVKKVCISFQQIQYVRIKQYYSYIIVQKYIKIKFCKSVLVTEKFSK